MILDNGLPFWVTRYTSNAFTDTNTILPESLHNTMGLNARKLLPNTYYLVRDENYSLT